MKIESRESRCIKVIEEPNYQNNYNPRCNLQLGALVSRSFFKDLNGIGYYIYRRIELEIATVFLPKIRSLNSDLF